MEFQLCLGEYPFSPVLLHAPALHHPQETHTHTHSHLYTQTMINAGLMHMGSIIILSIEFSTSSRGRAPWRTIVCSILLVHL